MSYYSPIQNQADLMCIDRRIGASVILGVNCSRFSP